MCCKGAKDEDDWSWLMLRLKLKTLPLLSFLQRCTLNKAALLYPPGHPRPSVRPILQSLSTNSIIFTRTHLVYSQFGTPTCTKCSTGSDGVWPVPDHPHAGSSYIQFTCACVCVLLIPCAVDSLPWPYSVHVGVGAWGLLPYIAPALLILLSPASPHVARQIKAVWLQA